jgi:hypothetical protein
MRKSKERKVAILYIHIGVDYWQIFVGFFVGGCVYRGMSKSTAVMLRRQYCIAPDQVEFLRQLARKTRQTKAFHVREALRLYAHKLGVKLEPERGDYFNDEQ